jgi:hypothetical protein
MISNAINTTMKSKDEPSIQPFRGKEMTRRVKIAKKGRSEDGE